MAQNLEWKVHTTRLLAEVLQNPTCDVLRQPMVIMDNLLRQVAARAIELGDPELDKLMLRLTLYSIADPFSPDHDPEMVSRLLGEEQEKAA